MGGSWEALLTDRLYCWMLQLLQQADDDFPENSQVSSKWQRWLIRSDKEAEKKSGVVAQVMLLCTTPSSRNATQSKKIRKSGSLARSLPSLLATLDWSRFDGQCNTAKLQMMRCESNARLSASDSSPSPQSPKSCVLEQVRIH